MRTMSNVLRCLFNRVLVITLCASPLYNANSQSQLEIEDLATWNRIKNVHVGEQGKVVTYSLEPDFGDPSLVIYRANMDSQVIFPRASMARISPDEKWVFFHLSTAQDSIRNLKRKKVKKKDLPLDSLGILDLRSGELSLFGNLKSFAISEAVPQKLIYHIHPKIEKKQDTVEVDTVQLVDTLGGKDSTILNQEIKEHSDENGFPLIIRSLDGGGEDTIDYVKEYVLNRKSDQRLRSNPRIHYVYIVQISS